MGEAKTGKKRRIKINRQSLDVVDVKIVCTEVVVFVLDSHIPKCTTSATDASTIESAGLDGFDGVVGFVDHVDAGMGRAAVVAHGTSIVSHAVALSNANRVGDGPGPTAAEIKRAVGGVVPNNVPGLKVLGGIAVNAVFCDLKMEVASS